MVKPIIPGMRDLGKSHKWYAKPITHGTRVVGIVGCLEPSMRGSPATRHGIPKRCIRLRHCYIAIYATISGFQRTAIILSHMVKGGTPVGEVGWRPIIPRLIRAVTTTPILDHIQYEIITSIWSLTGGTEFNATFVSQSVANNTQF